MNLSNWNMISLMIIIALISGNWLYGYNVRDKNSEFYDYQEAFKGAVSDTGAYLGQLEAQQTASAVSYSKEKNLAVDMDIISSFYENVALRFGIQDVPGMTQDIMRHTPVMAIINYDNFQIVTPEISNGILKPTIGEERPFTQVLGSGDILYYSLDNTVTLYQKSSNRFLDGTIQEIMAYTNTYPIVDMDSFETNKQVSIASAIQKAMEKAIGDYNTMMGNNGYNIRFGIPIDIASEKFSSVGFLAFMQGYPLPSGEKLDSFSFGSSNIRKGREFYGVIRSDGKHVAYEKSCGVPTDTFLIEVLYGEKEAARKGYFVEPCTH